MARDEAFSHTKLESIKGDHATSAERTRAESSACSLCYVIRFMVWSHSEWLQLLGVHCQVGRGTSPSCPKIIASISSTSAVQTELSSSSASSMACVRATPPNHEAVEGDKRHR